MRISLVAMALAAFAVSAVSSGVRGADPMGVDQPGDYTLSGVQPSQLKGTTMVYETLHVSLAESAEPLKKAVADLYVRLKGAHVMPTGGPVIVFKGVLNPNVPMDIEVGVPVTEKTAVPEGCAVRELASIPSVIGIFKGPFSALGRAYPEFFRQLTQIGKTPSGELRQRTLYYEGENSVNNIVLMEMQTTE